MRLTPEEVSAIKQAAAEAFGADSVVRLFGSRVHDHLRGGDIDLLVEHAPDLNDPFACQTRMWSALQRALDEQKIDIVRVARDAPGSAIVRIARRDGIAL